MPTKAIHTTLTFLIAAVWLANGLFCKVLNLVPRHQLIVGRILGEEYAGLWTKAIGVAEIVMAIWIVSAVKTRLNAFTQILVVATMNVMEFVLVPDLLLFGRMNAIFAFLLVLTIYCNEFVFNKNLAQPT